jgi:stage V sporulation protein B
VTGSNLVQPSSGRRPGGAPLARDALLTIATRFGLAVLIFGTDIVLARLLGPAAKGRFTVVLLYSQLAALVVGWGMDQALGVVAGRDRETARRGFANAVIWSAVVGGATVLVSMWLYGLPTATRPEGPLARLVPNLSGFQFVYSALAVPGELFFSIGLFALLGRGRVAAYSLIRLLRRGVLLVLVLGSAALATLNLDAALIMNLVALAATAAAIGYVAWRDDTFSLRPGRDLLAEELRFGSRALIGSAAERLQFRADTFFVNAMLGIRATGIYSVTSGLAETLWYVPNALGVVMFSRAVDPGADAGRVASVLTRTTLAVSVAAAIPAYALGPRLVRLVYGPTFTDAGVALRVILPGIVAYSVVAILSRYIVGQGRPGLGTIILMTGLVANVVSNLSLVPVYGINGASAASSISYGLTAVLALIAFHRMSGRGYVETLVVRRSDLAAIRRVVAAVATRRRGGQGAALINLESDLTAEMIIAEHEPGEEA